MGYTSNGPLVPVLNAIEAASLIQRPRWKHRGIEINQKLVEAADARSVAA